MRLTFDLDLVKRLLEHSINAPERAPTLDQLFDPELRIDGKEPNMLGDKWPTKEDLKPGVIGPGLTLVGDQGVYFMSNGVPGIMADGTAAAYRQEGKRLVCYADQCNPEDETLEFDEWYENTRRSFGGDDGTVALPREFIEDAIKYAVDGKVVMNVTPKQISVPVRRKKKAA